MSDQHSFTLIELLIVIGILAILVAAVVIALNPAQLLAQARDGKRQQDLSALNQSLNTIYALDQSVSFGTSSIVYTSLPDTSTSCASWFPSSSLPVGWQYHCSPTTTLQNTDGTGWIPVNFKTTGVVSLASLPLDPINTSSTGLYYTYVSGGSFELTAAFESTKYKLGGDKDIASTDGGSYPDLYEVGSNLALQPMDHGDPSLVGYWPLNEGTGTIAYDRSGKGNNGTLVNGPTWTNDKKIGSFALDFDGAGKRVAIASPIGQSGNTTISAWYKRSSSGSSSYRTIIGVATGNVHHLIIEPTSNRIMIFDGVSQYSSYITPNDGMYHQYLMVYNNGVSAILYVDGNYTGQITTTLNFVTNPVGSIGNWSGGGYQAGLIDDVRIYNRALSASEIQALYNAAK